MGICYSEIRGNLVRAPLGPPIDEANRLFLVEHFQPRIQRLEKLIGVARDGWRPARRDWRFFPRPLRAELIDPELKRFE